ncbi:hypothetical protein [Ralstonia phage RP31]|uniref:Uncharacterized protein n=2 Tax=Ripduovirus RP12 TaxID=2560700 RepID=A0A1L7N0Z5_9CAUD|nr:hypothetical protein FDH28_gp248 [Ralstonia phage RP12]BAW19147.1 hypothetical protein [Ralstonia phage RP12]BAW19433.1 hypothetical protein [Ralstonia phage RP31]
MSKTPNQITDELIAKYLRQGDYSCLLPREQQGIRDCIKAALSIGQLTAMLDESKTPLEKSMAESALAFESELYEGTDVTKEKCSAYPWGWRYTSETLQQQFRQFCTKQAQQILKKG